MKINKIEEKIRLQLQALELSFFHFFEKEKIRRFCFGLTIFISFGCIYILNRLHPLVADDWGYSLKMLPSTQRIAGVGDILHFQYLHYFTWGGRTVAHIIVQLLLLAGKPLASVINATAFVIFTLLIYVLANKGNRLNSSLLIGINLLFYLFQQAFGSAILWITGSGNYLWCTGIILAFLIPYVNEVRSLKTKNSYLRTGLFFVFGIIAGWTNENMGVALVCMLAILLFYYKTKLQKLPYWTVSGFLGSLIGCSLMIAAPGNYNRYATAIVRKRIDGPGIQIFFSRFLGSLSAFFYFSMGFVFVFAITWILFQNFSRKEKNNKVNFLAALFFVGAIIATLAMSASPLFPNRASFGLNTFIIVASALLYANINSDLLFIKRLKVCILCFGILFFASDYVHAYNELSATNKEMAARIHVVIEGKAKGEQNFVFHQRIANPQTRFLHYYELSTDTLNWQNALFARYYGLRTVRVE